MRLRWLALTLLLACGDKNEGSERVDATLAPRPDASIDASRDAARTPRDASDICALGKPEFQGLAGMRYAVTLDELCGMLEKDGRIQCPRTRAAYAQSVSCEKGGRFPYLRRHCDLDVEEGQFVGDFYVVWVFDRETGALRRGSVSGPLAPCGEGSYVADAAPWPTCDRNDEECALCESGQTRDADCPADVLAAHPSVACEAPPGASCDCRGWELSPEKLPMSGAPALATCADCQDGTCWSTVACTTEGVYRWRLHCAD